jgi:hypothetical protein
MRQSEVQLLGLTMKLSLYIDTAVFQNYIIPTVLCIQLKCDILFLSFELYNLHECIICRISVKTVNRKRLTVLRFEMKMGFRKKYPKMVQKSATSQKVKRLVKVFETCFRFRLGVNVILLGIKYRWAVELIHHLHSCGLPINIALSQHSVLIQVYNNSKTF